jgi:hypothetical protein
MSLPEILSFQGCLCRVETIFGPPISAPVRGNVAEQGQEHNQHQEHPIASAHEGIKRWEIMNSFAVHDLSVGAARGRPLLRLFPRTDKIKPLEF